jgi:hypothetical protein
MRNLLTTLLVVSAFTAPAQKRDTTYTSVHIDKITVKEFIDIAGKYDRDVWFGNALTVWGTVNKEWLSKQDLAYLFGFIRSQEKCRCITRAYSSYRPPVSEYSTVGGLACELLDMYRLGTEYPSAQWACTKTWKERVEALEDWWRTRGAPK